MDLLGLGSNSVSSRKSGSVVTRRLFLLITTVTSAVLASATLLAVASRGTVGAGGTTADGSLRAGGSLVGRRHDLGGQMKILAEILETLIGKGVEVPLPAELSVHVSSAGQGLHGLDDVKVRNLQLKVLDLEQLWGDQDAFLKQSRVDELAVILRNDPGGSRMGIRSV